MIRLVFDDLTIANGAITHVTARIFDDTILELAVFAEIGAYDLWQAWLFHKSGRLQPMLYSSGWACGDDKHENDHKHHPYWRIDFDVEGASNDVWRIASALGGAVTLFHKRTVETNWRRQSSDETFTWSINKPGSPRHVRVRYQNNELRDKAAGPWFGFSNKDVGLRRYHPSEDEGWVFDWNVHLGYKWLVAENTQNKDIVLWVVGHLSHPWSASDQIFPQWHYTGPIIDVEGF